MPTDEPTIAADDPTWTPKYDPTTYAMRLPRRPLCPTCGGPMIQNAVTIVDGVPICRHCSRTLAAPDRGDAYNARPSWPEFLGLLHDETLAHHTHRTWGLVWYTPQHYANVPIDVLSGFDWAHKAIPPRSA